LADRCVTLGKDTPELPWLRFCKGLADYRRGNFRAAFEGLNALVPQTGGDLPEDLAADCHLVLAMALHRQGQTKAAREHLTRAAKLLDQKLSDPDRFPTTSVRSLYVDRLLIAWLLHREAQTLIEGEKGKSKK
jgi:hypothetical protein